jgi:hypothetical protein
MVRRLIAVTAAVVLVALLAPTVLFGGSVSSVSIIALGAVALVGGFALAQDESPAARRAGRVVAIGGLVVLAFGAGLFVLLYFGAFRGY